MGAAAEKGNPAGKSAQRGAEPEMRRAVAGGER